MNIEDRVERVENRADRAERRDDLIEKAILQMRDLILSHDDRLEGYFTALRESRDDFNFKLNALIESQMKNETDIRELRESTKNLTESIIELREWSKELQKASTSQLTCIENLESK